MTASSGGVTNAPRVLTAWNEPNHYLQPTFGSVSGGRRAGRFYNALRRLCEKAQFNCTVAAGDFIENNHIRRYTKYFKEGAHIRAGEPPAAWAYHPYRTAFFAPSLAAAKTSYEAIRAGFTGVGTVHYTQVWFTEIGGRYTRTGSETDQVAQSRQRDQLCMAIRLARSYSEITRFYQYELRGGLPWDTGLMDSTGATTRQTYDTYRYYAAKAGSSTNACP